MLKSWQTTGVSYESYATNYGPHDRIFVERKNLLVQLKQDPRTFSVAVLLRPLRVWRRYYYGRGYYARIELSRRSLFVRLIHLGSKTHDTIWHGWRLGRVPAPHSE